MNRGRKIQRLLEISHHVFRIRRLCSSATYQTAIGEAQAEMDAQAPPDAHQINDQVFRRERTGRHGFFWEPPVLAPRDGHRMTAPVAGHLEFRHASKRYKDGWNAGKEPS